MRSPPISLLVMLRAGPLRMAAPSKHLLTAKRNVIGSLFLLLIV